MKKKVTIPDIAKIAGASPATVSRVLSESSYPVRQELRDKIQRVAQELNYIPNLLGKQLKKNSNNTIGVIVPSISNPFYSVVVMGIQEVVRKHNHHIMLCPTLNSREAEDEYLNSLVQMQIRGLIISSVSINHKLLKKLKDTGVLIIAIDQKIDSDAVCNVEFDYRKGGYMATRHLIDKGHREIALLIDLLDRPSRRDIHQGYMDAMKEAGIEVRADWMQVAKEDAGKHLDRYVLISRHEFNNGEQFVKRLLALPKLPTALFVANDMMAIGVMHELRNKGIRVPDDISIVGFDDIPFASMITPTLTSIIHPDYEMGKLACNLLFDMLATEQLGGINGIVLQPGIYERKSVKAI